MKPHLEILGLHLDSYGLMMFLALASAFLALQRGMRRRGIRVECAVAIAATAFGCALLGGYALYMLSSVGLAEIIAAARAGRLLAALSHGGLVFYGGLAGGALGAWLGARIVDLRFAAIVDLCAPAVALAHAIGRVGCLLAGCCYGRPSALFFSFPLSPYIAGGASLFPVQLFEAGANLALFGALTIYQRRPRPVPRAAGIYLMGYAAFRFVLEFFRGDAIRGRVFALSTSQFLSIPTFLLGAALCFFIARRGIDPNPFLSDIGKA